MHLRFGHGETGFRCLGQGWSDVEGSSVWAVGRRSTLVIPTLAWCPTGYILRLYAEPHAVAGRTQTVRLLLDGICLGEHEVHGHTPVTVPVPAGLAGHRGSRELVLEAGYGVSPASMDAGGDERELSFCLAGVWITANLHDPDLIEPPVAGLDDRAVMMGFDSLGDDCEFGFVQRAHKAEPISLLRFGGMVLHRLHEALECEFDGIDDPANLSIRVQEPGEYMISNERYRYLYHTFVHSWEMSREDLIRQEIMRLRFGRRKLVEDLEDGDKIFVVKTSSGPGLRRDDVASLAELIARYGGATLLWVCPSDDDVAPGSVRWIGPNLVEARIDTLCLPGHAGWFSPHWLPLCRRVHRTVHQHRGRASLRKAAE